MVGRVWITECGSEGAVVSAHPVVLRGRHSTILSATSSWSDLERGERRRGEGGERGKGRERGGERGREVKEQKEREER